MKMLLRGSSTPQIGGTLRSPFSDTPNRDFDTTNKKCNKHTPPPLLYDYHINGLSFSHVSCSSSPISHGHSASHFSESNQQRSSFRRAWSDGNLESLSYSSYCDIEEFGNSSTPTKKKSLHKRNKSTGTNMLQSSPSFSIYNDEFQDEEETVLERSVRIGESTEGEFSFGNMKSMGLIEEGKEDEEEEEGLNGIQNLIVEEAVNEAVSPRMHLASGLGIDTFGVADDSSDVEDYYKKMVDQYPCHPLFLRNYAHVLQVSLLL
jgi:hypothetical protein